ncbi:MAG: electron transfer flavoprotein subunit beta/FixA family protein [Bacteroidetes bacterium]|nr:electron transfer flavoprotein subunit beta/FixA family protein [Bacteroidota bacterium]
MKILVCISVVPDTTTKISFTDNNTRFNNQGVQYIINPYDELALTRAMELAEASNGTVHVIHVGTADSEASIRKALSIGAHEAIRVNAEPADAQFVAAQIAAVAQNAGYDLILTGRESIDYNGGAVCGLLGQLLGIPSVNVASKIDVSAGTATVEHDIDGGREVVTVQLPAVISAQKDLCEPRIPNMRGIMAARTKPLQITEPGAATAASGYVAFELPAPKQGVKLIDAENPAELLYLLRNEAKVI